MAGFRSLGLVARGVLAGLAFLVNATSLAWPPSWGPEFTFSNPELTAARNEVLKSDRDQVAWKKYRDLQEGHNARLFGLYEARCAREPQCRVRYLDRTDPQGVYPIRVEYEDGFWFQVLSDPAVKEVITKPSTRIEFRERKALLQADIFDVMAEAGLRPEESFGGGHLNLGVASTFDGNATFARDAYVDFENNRWLFDGVLGFAGNRNGRAVAELDANAQAAVSAAIARFDQEPATSLEDFIRSLSEALLRDGDTWAYDRKKQFAVSLRDQVWELRNVLPQRNVDVFLAQLETLEGRLDFNRQRKTRVKLEAFAKTDLNPEALGQRYANYFREMGRAPTPEQIALAPFSLPADTGAPGCLGALRRLFTRKP